MRQLKVHEIIEDGVIYDINSEVENTAEALRNYDSHFIALEDAERMFDKRSEFEVFVKSFGHDILYNPGGLWFECRKNRLGYE